jgi:hypothetical protein
LKDGVEFEGFWRGKEGGKTEKGGMATLSLGSSDVPEPSRPPKVPANGGFA